MSFWKSEAIEESVSPDMEYGFFAALRMTIYYFGTA